MKVAFLIGRIIVGLFYLYNGVNHFIKFSDMTDYANYKGVPLAGVGVAVSGIFLLVGAVTLLIGKFTDIGVAAIVAFFIPVTFMMHNFWAVGAEQKMAEMVNFSKNLALMGSTLMFLGIKKPWPFSIAGPKGE